MLCTRGACFGAGCRSYSNIPPLFRNEFHLSELALYLENSGTVFVLTPGEHSVGRSRTCDICLRGTGVSRKHARLVITDGMATLTDLESKNGTLVNDQVVVGSVHLSPRDRIQIGRFRLTTVTLARPRSEAVRVSRIPSLTPHDEHTQTASTAAAARVLDLVEVLVDDLRRTPDPNTITTIVTAVDDLLDSAGVAYPYLSEQESRRLSQLVEIVAPSDASELSRWKHSVLARLGTALYPRAALG